MMSQCPLSSTRTASHDEHKVPWKPGGGKKIEASIQICLPFHQPLQIYRVLKGVGVQGEGVTGEPKFQVPKMEGFRTNLMFSYFGAWVVPYISRIHTAYIGEDSSIPEVFGELTFHQPLQIGNWYYSNLVSKWMLNNV